MSSYQHSAPKAGDAVAVVETPFGKIKYRLFPQEAPKTVENFETHAKNGYYDGVKFHRIIRDFMAQGGDPTGTGAGGESIWGRDFADECTPKLNNVRGALSMANAGRNTNGSQFFLVHRDAQYLDGKHTVFGQVYEGMDVLDRLCATPTDRDDRPKSPVAMKIKAGTFGDAGL